MQTIVTDDNNSDVPADEDFLPNLPSQEVILDHLSDHLDLSIISPYLIHPPIQEDKDGDQEEESSREQDLEDKDEDFEDKDQEEKSSREQDLEDEYEDFGFGDSEEERESIEEEEFNEGEEEYHK